ncbi:hypothetical protein V565_029080 [Rhizoctonia solani 123E]|uniref:Uncharacterized protein n=1 Tax=Rhizoctonia solani 123E TaxID=1423351 RepID=A0A074S2W8_9AGAM|nr:hypothetical protein V565_029080 [Rhizoctonia solani 123E]
MLRRSCCMRGCSFKMCLGFATESQLSRSNSNMASTSSTTTASPKASSAATTAPSPAAKAAGSEQPRPILETTWHALSQAPPPSLREILSAYNAKGEGDREMLVALLNAKSAEDQRLASLAALHQTVLQMQHAIAIAAVTAQQPAARPVSQPQSSRKKRSHAEYAPEAYRAGAYDDREPPLPPSPDSSASGSSPRADFPHLSNPSTMSIRTLLHPSKRRRESGYDERDRERERDHERAYIEDREYRSRSRPHVVVHPPPAEREYRHAMRTSSARDESHESRRSPST